MASTAPTARRVTDTGDRGLQGLQGPQGLKGDAGDRGPKGDPGTGSGTGGSVDPIAIDFNEQVPLDTSGFGKEMAVKVLAGGVGVTLVPLAAGKIENGFCVVRIVSDGVAPMDITAWRKFGADLVPEANRKFLLTCIRRFDEDVVFVEKLGLTSGTETPGGGTGGGTGWTAEDDFQRANENPLFMSSSGHLWQQLYSDRALFLDSKLARTGGLYQDAASGFDVPASTRITATATISVSPNEGGEGIIFRAVSSPEAFSYWTFSRDAGPRQFTLNKRISANSTTVAATAAPNWDWDGLEHTLSVECTDDNRIICKADGVLIFDVVDDAVNWGTCYGIRMDGASRVKHFKVTAA